MVDQKGLLVFESKQGDHTFSYSMPLGSSWENAMKAASEIFTGLQEHVKTLEEEEKKRKKAAPEVAAELVE